MVRTLLVLAFWGWFGVSTVVLVRRMLTRKSREQHKNNSSSDDAIETRAAELIERARAEQPREEQSVWMGAAAPTGTGDRTEDARTERRDRLLEPEERPRLTETVGSLRLRTIADMLEGITMPCDLAPYVGTSPAGRTDASRRVAFTTTTASAAEIDVALREELERLGYEVETARDVLVARRDDDTVEVRIHASAARVPAADAISFAGAPPEAAAVELIAR